MIVVGMKEKVHMGIYGNMESDTIQIKCKKSKRFLAEINYDEIIALLEQYGGVLERPLQITTPCRTCHESETYNIYKEHYVFKENKTLKN